MAYLCELSIFDDDSGIMTVMVSILGQWTPNMSFGSEFDDLAKSNFGITREIRRM